MLAIFVCSYVESEQEREREREREREPPPPPQPSLWLVDCKFVRKEASCIIFKETYLEAYAITS